MWVIVVFIEKKQEKRRERQKKKKNQLEMFSKRWLSVRYAIIEKYSQEKACPEKIDLLNN